MPEREIRTHRRAREYDESRLAELQRAEADAMADKVIDWAQREVSLRQEEWVSLGIPMETLNEITRARAEYEKERMPFSAEDVRSVYKDHLRREIEAEMAEQRRLNSPESS